MWTTLVHAGQVARLDPKSGEVTRFELGAAESRPMVIAPGPDGAIWFTVMTADRIGRITVDGEVTEYDVPVAGGFVSMIAAGPTGLWFTLNQGNAIGRSTLDGAIEVLPLPTEGAAPVGIAARHRRQGRRRGRLRARDRAARVGACRLRALGGA